VEGTQNSSATSFAAELNMPFVSGEDGQLGGHDSTMANQPKLPSVNMLAVSMEFLTVKCTAHIEEEVNTTVEALAAADPEIAHALRHFRASHRAFEIYLEQRRGKSINVRKVQVLVYRMTEKVGGLWHVLVPSHLTGFEFNAFINRLARQVCESPTPPGQDVSAEQN
jgi:hypothetical protein